MRACLIILALLAAASPASAQVIVNDITQLNPVEVERVVAPTSVAEVSALVAAHDGPISIGGGRYSQGGQTACAGCLFIDMRALNRVIALDKEARTITVQAGITWREIQEAIDPENLSPTIMQSYSNFTVGGSISVNCHGDYVGLGPLIESLRSIVIVLADGSAKTASRTENRDLFRAAVGGYGGVGVIVEATLDVTDNVKLERRTVRMPLSEYQTWRAANITGSDTAVLHHAVIYPPTFTSIAVELASLTDKPVTIAERLPSTRKPSPVELAMLDFVTHNPLGPTFRELFYDPITSGRTEVVWRNYEAAGDVNGLEPASRATSTYALQEYFVPVDRFDSFTAAMSSILREHKANVLNIAIRHTRRDTESLLSWAPQDVYSFVLYYEQGTDERAVTKVAEWSRKLVAAAVAEGGAWYLPYQIHGTREQFLQAYPGAQEFFAIKRRVDPTYKFRNRLWEAYYS